MGRMGLALIVFWKTLVSGAVAARVRQALVDSRGAGAEPAESGGEASAPPAVPESGASAGAVSPARGLKRVGGRSEALTLLAALQREGRLVDFLKEPLGEYSDAQIGAAVRDVHRDCAKVVERLFGLEPVLAGDEGSRVEVPADAERFRLVGEITGEGPYRGTLVHAGWMATRCEIPEWTGRESGARVIAPAEVEVGGS